MGRLSDLSAMIRERRVGFLGDEVMTGWHRFEPGFGPPGRHFFEFRVTWGTKHLGRWLDPTGDEFMINDMHGTFTATGLCEDAPCEGILELKYFDEHLLRYVLDFEADGRPHRFVGEKVNIRPWNLPVSHTTCFGRITESDGNRLVSTAECYFRFRTAPRFAASFRLA